MSVDTDLARHMADIDASEALRDHVDRDDASLYLNAALEALTESDVSAEDWEALTEAGEACALSVAGQIKLAGLAWELGEQDGFSRYQ